MPGKSTEEAMVRIAEIDQEIAELHADDSWGELAEVAEKGQIVEAYLGSVIEDITETGEDIKESVEDYSSVGGKVKEFFEDPDVKKGIEGVQGGLESTTNILREIQGGIGKFNEFVSILQSGEGLTSGNAQEQLETAAEVYVVIVTKLEPFIDKIPVIGAFIQIWGLGISRAAEFAGVQVERVDSLNEGYAILRPGRVLYATDESRRSDRIRDLEYERAQLLNDALESATAELEGADDIDPEADIDTTDRDIAIGTAILRSSGALPAPKSAAYQDWVDSSRNLDTARNARVRAQIEYEARSHDAEVAQIAAENSSSGVDHDKLDQQAESAARSRDGYRSTVDDANANFDAAVEDYRPAEAAHRAEVQGYNDTVKANLIKLIPSTNSGAGFTDTDYQLLASEYPQFAVTPEEVAAGRISGTATPKETITPVPSDAPIGAAGSTESDEGAGFDEMAAAATAVSETLDSAHEDAEDYDLEEEFPAGPMTDESESETGEAESEPGSEAEGTSWDDLSEEDQKELAKSLMRASAMMMGVPYFEDPEFEESESEAEETESVIPELGAVDQDGIESVIPELGAVAQEADLLPLATAWVRILDEVRQVGTTTKIAAGVGAASLAVAAYILFSGPGAELEFEEPQSEVAAEDPASPAPDSADESASDAAATEEPSTDEPATDVDDPAEALVGNYSGGVMFTPVAGSQSTSPYDANFTVTIVRTEDGGFDVVLIQQPSSQMTSGRMDSTGTAFYTSGGVPGSYDEFYTARVRSLGSSQIEMFGLTYGGMPGPAEREEEILRALTIARFVNGGLVLAPGADLIIGDALDVAEALALATAMIAPGVDLDELGIDWFFAFHGVLDLSEHSVTIGNIRYVILAPTEVRTGADLMFTVCAYDASTGDPMGGLTGYFTIGQDPAGSLASHASDTFGSDGCFSGSVRVNEPPGHSQGLTSNGSAVAKWGDITINP